VEAIPFDLPPVTGNEITYLTEEIRRREFEAEVGLLPDRFYWHIPARLR
jgi:hypothetical protein